MMKHIVFGDIHGRKCWRKVIDLEKPDKVIFLGDYVSSHEGISGEQQRSNLEDIMTFKENNMDDVIMLLGNHDLQHLGYPWAHCCCLDPYVYRWLSSKDVSKRFLELTQAIHIQDNIIFSHAGVSKVWWENQFMGDPTKENLLKINDLEPNEMFMFTPDSMYDTYGDSVTQSPVWIRPNALLRSHLDGWDQVVGHTRISKPGNIITDDFKEIAHNHGLDLKMNECWFIDCLPDQYMVIEDDIRKMRDIKL